MNLHDLYDALVVAAWIAAVGFPVVYVFYPWWLTPAGRSVMTLAVVIALAMSLSAWRVFFGPPPAGMWIVLFALIDIALWVQLIVLLLAPRLNARRQARSKEDSHVRT